VDRAPGSGATQVTEAGPLHPTPVGNSPRILILFSDTGGGHRAAARALTDALGLLDPTSLPIAGVETAGKMLDPRSVPSNLLMKRTIADEEP